MKISTETANKVKIPSSSRFTISRVIGRNFQEKARFHNAVTSDAKSAPSSIKSDVSGSTR
jgi:hypothetical protein